MNTAKPLIISMGEPAGIGTQICLKLALNKKLAEYVKQQNPNLKLVIFGNLQLLKDVAEKFSLPVEIQEIKSLNEAKNFTSGTLQVMNFPLLGKNELGKLNAENSPYVLQLISQATQACLNQEARGLTTAPLHKGIINDAGISFSGHTEFLQSLCTVDQVVMMLATEDLRVALATTHLPLREVADAITADKLRSVISILHEYLQKYYAIEKPHIGVCGLNPHAGEGGYLGMEEILVINPLVQQMRSEGYNLTDALPADTIFTPEVLADKDAVLSMYHDQGLPTLKYAGWEDAINITLGLPIVRTSPDHGTALNLAPLGTASETSIVSALIQADKISQRI